MKIKDYIFALLLTLSITINLVPYRQENGCKCESILPEIKTAILDVREGINKININKDLLDKIDQLTRDNEQYKITIESQRVQIQAFDEIFEGVGK
jgi:hypothetical protein